MIESFFEELDGLWPDVAARVTLPLMGSGALFFQSDYRRNTKDGDILRTLDVAEETAQTLLALAGRGTELHERRSMFIEVLRWGFPFLPQILVWHPVVALNARLRRLEVHALDVVDVVVSKLAPFRPNDRDDIEAMVSRGLLPHERLVERFRAAMDYLLGDAREVDLPKFIDHLHIVERDMLQVDETEMSLPSWI